MTIGIEDVKRKGVRVVENSDGSVTYHARYTDPDGKRRFQRVQAVPAKGKANQHRAAANAAEAKAAELREAVKRGTWVDPQKEARRKKEEEQRKKRAALTFGAAVDRFLDEYRSRSGRRRYYQQRAEVWKRHLGEDTPLLEISSSDVSRFRNARTAELRKRNRSGLDVEKRQPWNGTVRKDLISLGTFFRWARGVDLVRENPADRDLVRRPSEPPKRNLYLTEKEQAGLLRHLPDWFAPMIRFALASGLDRAELHELDLRDVDLEGRLLDCTRSKSSVPRLIPLEGDLLTVAAEAVEVAREVFPFDTGSRQPLFVKDGERLRPEDSDAALAEAYEGAGISKPEPWKILRHTFGTEKARQGCPQQKLQALMGHKSPVTTSRYIHLAADDLRDAMRGTNGGEKTAQPKAQ